MLYTSGKNSNPKSPSLFRLEKERSCTNKGLSWKHGGLTQLDIWRNGCRLLNSKPILVQSSSRKFAAAAPRTKKSSSWKTASDFSAPTSRCWGQGRYRYSTDWPALTQLGPNDDPTSPTPGCPSSNVWRLSMRRWWRRHYGPRIVGYCAPTTWSCSADGKDRSGGFFYRSRRLQTKICTSASHVYTSPCVGYWENAFAYNAATFGAETGVVCQTFGGQIIGAVAQHRHYALCGQLARRQMVGLG